jgi:hypothetical protein
MITLQAEVQLAALKTPALQTFLRRSALAGFTLLVLLCAAPRGSAAGDKLTSLCDVHYPSDNRIEWECRKLKWGDTPFKLFGKYWQDVLRFNRMDRRHFLGGMSIKVPKRIEDIEGFSPMPVTWPDAATEEKFILVDQSEMFLGAYEYGELFFSSPIAVGIEDHRVPNGEFRVDAVDLRHESNLYKVEKTNRPYPMHYGLRFYVMKGEEKWVSYWLHGRDVPGYPASHGCIGLYDEEMQKKYYHEPQRPILKDAKQLYEWVLGPRRDSGSFHTITGGPRVLIIGTPPL